MLETNAGVVAGWERPTRIVGWLRRFRRVRVDIAIMLRDDVYRPGPAQGERLGGPIEDPAVRPSVERSLLERLFTGLEKRSAASGTAERPLGQSGYDGTDRPRRWQRLQAISIWGWGTEKANRCWP